MYFDAHELVVDTTWKNKTNKEPGHWEIDATFLGVNISSLSALANFKSWCSAYLYNKIGGLESKGQGWGNESYGYLHFSKSQKNKEVYLHCWVNGGPNHGKETHLDYRQVVMIDIVLGKILGQIS